MNRELRFRAWDGTEMIGPFVLGSRNAGECFNPDWEVMQYTGLEDRYGVSIYECDILRCRANSGQIIGRVEYTEKIGYGVRDAAGAWQGMLAPKNDVEVIGNIYQNVELMGQESNGS